MKLIEPGEGSYVYYEIWTTMSEWKSECVEKCVSFEIAKAHMANHSDWCRPAGTGKIYKIKWVPDENGTIHETHELIHEVK